MPTPILATKLYIPPPRPNVVLRPRLIERLNEGLRRKLILISAAAGFGKTTLVSEWLAAIASGPTSAGREEGVKAAWLSLDEGDSDLARFLRECFLKRQKRLLTLNEAKASAKIRRKVRHPDRFISSWEYIIKAKNSLRNSL